MNVVKWFLDKHGLTRDELADEIGYDAEHEYFDHTANSLGFFYAPQYKKWCSDKEGYTDRERETFEQIKRDLTLT